MQRIDDFSDDRSKAWCIHCTKSLIDLEFNEDHAPSKSFLQDPRPDNLPVMKVCRECNNGFSRDEAYMVACLSAALSGTTDPEKQLIPSAARILTKSVPLQQQIVRSSEYMTIGGERRLVWRPDLDRVNRIVLKNARGHAFFEIGEPMMMAPQSVHAFPLEAMESGERSDFEHSGGGLSFWPEVGSRMLERSATGIDLTNDGWVNVQLGVYRYIVLHSEALIVRSVLYEYLATEVRWSN